MRDYKHYEGIAVTRSGIEYPDFALGTYMRTEEELISILKEYPYDRLMIDTAYRYGNEQVVSKAIKKSGYPQNQIVVIGKINTSQQESGKSIKEELYGTLTRLGILAIDIYLIHSNRSPYYCKTWLEMIDLQKEGLIQTIGVSNFDISDIERLYKISGVYPEINQIVLPSSVSLSVEADKQGIIEYCKEREILIQVAMPFGGKDVNNDLDDHHRQKILKQLRHQGVTCIFGTSNFQHLNQNIYWIEMGRND